MDTTKQLSNILNFLEEQYETIALSFFIARDMRVISSPM